MVPIKEALTFDDVTMIPKYSEVLPSDVNTQTDLSKNLILKIPLLSSAMDTITESKMAIAIAKAGGIGVIHRNLKIKKQIQEIKKVINSLEMGVEIIDRPAELASDTASTESVMLHALNYIQTDSSNSYIVATESGILHQMRKYCPKKTFD